jgi:Flp pilus assembly protein TadG
MVALMRFVRRFLRAESGAELIEFGLTLPLLLLLVLGMIEFGFLFREYEIVTNAAREGARIAVLPTYSATPAARTNNATARAKDYIAAPATGCVFSVPVTVTYPHPVPFIGGIMRFFTGAAFGPMTVRATSQMRTEAVAAATCP